MKTGLHKTVTTSGSVLFLCLLVGTLLGATLGTYLLWVRSQNVLVAESQAWNAALANAEAGIEEGMAQVNVDAGRLTQSTNYLNSVLTNGWVGLGLGGGFYGPRTNSVLDGSYSVIISPTTPGPTITATGYTKVPLISQPIARTVQVTTTTMPVFGQAMVAKNGITTKGNGLTVDSFNSCDPNYSTGGNYDPAKHQDGGDIASISGLINVQNANIYGHMKTSPLGSYSIGNGSVGDLAWTGPGVKPGWYANDWYMFIPDISAPYSSGWAVPYNKNNATNTYPLVAGNYYVNGDFVMSQNETMNVNGDCVLYVTGNFNMKSQNNCQINILSGGSLTLYVGTKDTSNPVSASLTQVNTPGIALNFLYFGLPSNTSLTWVGNNTYVGAVYAPEADFSCGGGGSIPIDYCGSCVVNSVTLNGHFNFHFDTCLTPRGPFSGYRVTSWTEL